MYRTRGINYVDGMNFVDIDKKLFEQYPVKFPVENELSIVTGFNGTGKTRMLEALRDYYIEQGESVLYFPTDRIFSFTTDEIDALEVLWAMSEEDNIMHKYNFKVHPWDITGMKGEYINSGMLQVLNLFGSIYYAKEPSIIMVDTFERSLHPVVRRTIISDIMKQRNTKKLILVAYSPEMWNDYMDHVFDINHCVNIREQI